jgi:hypothetical protein
MLSLRELLHRAIHTTYHQSEIFRGRKKPSAIRRWNVRQLDRSFRRRPLGRIEPSPELRDPTPAAVHSFVRRRIPVVLRGAASEWSATKTWSLQFFKERYGDEGIMIPREEIERGREGSLYSIEFEPFTVGKFVDAVESGGSAYLKFLPFLKEHPELLEDLDWAACARWSGAKPGRHAVSNEFYMGGAKSVTHLHTERSDIFHACVEGRKRWVLFPASNAVFLYPVPARTLFVGSEVDFTAPSPEAHPWYRYANGYEVVLEKGDVLYVPSFCWHAVENLTTVISANYLWTDHWRGFTSMPLTWINGEVLARRGAGTLRQFVEQFHGRFVPNIHS